MTRVVFAGIATTGPTPAEHQTWEVALVERRDDGSQHEHHLFSHPKLSNADPRHLAELRYYERTTGWPLPSNVHRAPPDDRPLPSPRWGERTANAATIARATAGAVLVAFDVADTAAHLDAFLRGTGYAPAWDSRLVDVAVLAAGYEAGRGYGALADADLPRCSTALEAALWATHLYDAVYGAPWGER